MCIDPKFEVPKRPMYQGSLELAPLTSEVEWRKHRIEDCFEDLEEDLDYILCYSLEEVYCH